MTGDEHSGSISSLFTRIVDLAKRTASRNAILGLIAVLPGLLILVMGWYVAAKETVDYSGSNQNIEAPAFGVFWSIMLMGGGFLVLLIADLWATLAAIHVAERERAGEKVTVGDAMAYAWKRFLNALGFTLIELFVVGGYAVVGTVILILIALPAMTLSEGTGSGATVNIIVAVIVGILVIVPVVYLFVIWSLGLNAVVIEKASPIDAFNHSKDAVKGAWWKVFFFSIAAVLVYQLLSTLISELLNLTGMYSAEMVAGDIDSDTPDTAEYLQFLGKSLDDFIDVGISYFLAMFIVPVYTTVLYMWRKERMDAAVVEHVAAGDEPGDFQYDEEKSE